MGTTSALTDITAGGTWTSGNTAIATVGSTGLVTANSTTVGTASITYTLPSGCIAIAVVTVNAYPAAITGPNQVCIGATIILSDATAGGAWSSTGNPITTTGSITGLFPGVDTITYQLPTGCSAKYLVTVNPLPALIHGSMVVCQGLTTTLSDIPGGGTWTSSVTSIATVNGSTGVVTGVAPGTTTITYTLPTGCYVDTLFTVNQLPLPISGTASVCLGLTTTLTDGTPGGTWSSSNGHATIGSSTGIVFGASVGTSVITYTLPTGCLNTIIVTVNPLPGTILGSSSVCDGQTITLSDAGGGTWSSSNTAIATVSSAGVVTGVVAGTVNITYTLGTGCIITKTITVNVLSPINGTTSLCIGLTTSLSDTSGGGGGTWSINNPAVGTISTSGVVTGIGQGTATVSYVLSSGCTATILVSVYPLPSVVNGTLTVCAGQTTTLSDNVTGGTWTSGNTSIATIGSSSGIVTGVAAGTTNITYTLGTGCVVNAVVTVYPFGPIVGPTNICQGLTYAYSDAAPGGLWSSSNPGVVSINATTGVATGGGTTGTATLTYTIFPTGCTATLTVTVNALGPINGNSDLCVGVSTIFSDAVTGGTWSSSNPVVASVGPVTGIVTGHNNGVAIISYVLPSGCTATLTVTVNTLAPITGPSTVCQTDSIALTDATPGGVWSTSDATTASVSSSGEVDGNNSGTAIISYSYGPGCVVIKPVSVYPSTPIFGNLNVCIGLTSTLSDTTAGGTWSSSNSGIASITPVGVVFGVHVGTATITYTLGTGCIRTAVVTVNITAAIQGMDSVCVGLTTTLTDATAGVTWSSSNTGVASVGSSTGVVLGNSQGTTTITATSPVGCLATVIVTVNPLPTAILGNAAVCVGLTTTLTDATTPGTWSSSNTGIATVGVTTGIVTGVTAGTATITYTLPTTCIITRVVTVNPLPVAITGQLAVCVNSASILTDASSGGTWSASNGHATIGSASGVLLGVSANGVNPSFDTITYTLGTGCIITAVATINPLPGNILGNFNICLGSTNALSDTTAGGTWASSNTAVGSVDPVGNVSGLTLGTTYITYTIPTGCLEVQEVTVDPLPQPINGIDSVCVGSFITLTDGTFGGTWTSSNTGVATVGSGTGVVTGVSAVINGGIDTITYTLGTGCTVTATITVDPLPTVINGNFNVCIGTCNTLSDATALGTWSSSDTAIAPVSASGVVCGHNLGVATITYTLPTGCVVTQQVTVDPLPLPITGSVPVCVGSTITLNDATLPPGSGTWTSSLVDTATVGLTTGVVTGVSSGTTTITYQLSATGCISTVIVTVDPLPNIITGNNEVCVLDSIQLTDSSHGGIWISGNTGLATVGSTGKVYGVDSGTVLISYQLPTGCYRTFSVTVNPLPGAIMGDSVVCVGSNILLSDASVGGTWTSSLTTIATINSVTGNLYGVDSGTTVVTYTSNLSCIAHRVVTVNPVPTPILGASALCNGFTTILSDTSSGGEWSASNPAITTVSPAGVVIFATNVTAHAPGTDTIFYTYPVTGCYAFKIFTVHPIPVITVTESPTGQICIGGSVQLSASGAGSGGTYAWTPPTALSLTTGTPVTASPTVTTTYTVVGTTQYGCKHDTTATVFVDSVLLHIHITGKDSICRGDRDTLIASGFTGSLFAWTPVTDLNCTICDTTVMTGGTAGVFPYVATAIDSFGCKFSATFTVTVNALPNITVSPNPAIVCRGSSTTLHASGAATYTWFPNAFLSCDNCANPIASDTQNLVYNVIGTSQYGCRDSILVPVSVLDTTMNTISKDTILCLGNSAQLIATSTSVDGSRPDYYLWIPGTGLNDSTIPNPVATPDTTTLYTLIIKENACFNDTEHVTVFVEPYPAITITTNPSVSGPIIAGTAVQLSASIGNEVLLTDYEWTPGTGLSCQHCYNTIASPSLTTTYTFTATSNYGCTSHADVTISLMCDNSQVFIPNTFTPNGDGHNDRFYVSGKGIGSVLRLSVYNRWGELMFETHNTNANDPAAGWDGTYKGVVLEPDVFVYIVQVTCELGGQPYNFKGDISLVR